MTMTQEEMLSKVNAAVKAISTDKLGDSKLPVEKRDEFIRTLSEGSKVMDDARQVTMNSDKYDIDRIGFSGGIMKKATEGEGTSGSEPDFRTNKLHAKEGIAKVEVTYSTLEDNIEKGNLEDSLLDLIADRASTDLEFGFIRGEEDDDSDDIEALTDGWLKKAENEIDGEEDSDFDQDDVTDMFDQMMDKIEDKYIRDESDWVFYVSRDVLKAYRKFLQERNTSLGDESITGGDGLYYEGIELKRTPGMPTGQAFLVPKENLVYGVHRDITIEDEKDIEKRTVKFVVTMRMDCHFEDENIAVVAKNFES